LCCWLRLHFVPCVLHLAPRARHWRKARAIGAVVESIRRKQRHLSTRLAMMGSIAIRDI